MEALTEAELLFFSGHEGALPIYFALRQRIMEAVPAVQIQVKKTQISFFLGHMFAAASFTPVRRAKDRPDPFLTLTFGLPCQVDSPRIDVATAPYPRRWTHHVTLGGAEDIDEEIMDLLRQAAAFAAEK